MTNKMIALLLFLFTGSTLFAQNEQRVVDGNKIYYHGNVITVTQSVVDTVTRINPESLKEEMLLIRTESLSHLNDEAIKNPMIDPNTGEYFDVYFMKVQTSIKNALKNQKEQEFPNTDYSIEVILDKDYSMAYFSLNEWDKDRKYLKGEVSPESDVYKVVKNILEDKSITNPEYRQSNHPLRMTFETR